VKGNGDNVFCEGGTEGEGETKVVVLADADGWNVEVLEMGCRDGETKVVVLVDADGWNEAGGEILEMG